MNDITRCSLCGYALQGEVDSEAHAKTLKRIAEAARQEQHEKLNEIRVLHQEEVTKLRSERNALERNVDDQVKRSLAQERERHAAETARLQAEKAAAEDRVAGEVQRKTVELQAQHAAEVAQMKAENELLERRAERIAQESVADVKVQHAAQLENLQREQMETQKRLLERIAQMEKAVVNKRAGVMGEGAEINLHNELIQAFPLDFVQRTGKGPDGGHDLEQRVRNEGGDVVGKIIYESKDTSRWMGEAWLSKIRRYKQEAQADHAVLVTMAFPKDVAHLLVLDGVVVVSPARMVEAVKLLRQQVLFAARTKQSESAKDAKRDALYQFMASNRYTTLASDIAKGHRSIRQWEQEDQKHLNSVWRKRKKVIDSVENAQEELAGEIEDCIGGVGREPD